MVATLEDELKGAIDRAVSSSVQDNFFKPSPFCAYLRGKLGWPELLRVVRALKREGRREEARVIEVALRLGINPAEIYDLYPGWKLRQLREETFRALYPPREEGE